MAFVVFFFFFVFVFFFFLGVFFVCLFVCFCFLFVCFFACLFLLTPSIGALPRLYFLIVIIHWCLHLFLSAL